MRRAGRKDWTQQAIVGALRSIGVTVLISNQEGFPDLLTESRGKWLPIEVKSPTGHLTPLQRQLLAVAPYPVVETVDQALALFGVGVSREAREE